MNEQYKFQEMLFSILEVAKVQNNQLTIDEIKKFFGDINLTEEQFEHVYAYLAANHIKVQGYINRSNNEYMKVIKSEEEDVNEDSLRNDYLEEEDPNSNLNEDVSNNKTTKVLEQDSMYLKMYLEDLTSIRDLTSKEENDLLKEAKVGNELSKQRLIESKLLLVVSIAKEYKNQGMLMEDIIGEGNMGLIEGINSLHDMSLDLTLNEFLTSYIRKAIEEAKGEYVVSNNTENRIVERAKYISDSANDLKEDLGRNPTLEELVHYTKLSKDEIKDILNMSGDSIKVEKHLHS